MRRARRLEKGLKETEYVRSDKKRGKGEGIQRKNITRRKPNMQGVIYSTIKKENQGNVTWK